MHIFCQICGGPAPPEVGAAECDTCHGKIQAAGAQKRRAFCASRPDLGPDFLPQMDAHVAVVTRRAVLASRPTAPHRRASSAKATPVRVGTEPGPPLVRVPSDGSRSFELYEEEHNALNCTLADNVGELNPPMEAYTEDCIWFMEGSGSHPGSPPAAFYSPPGFRLAAPDVPSLPPSPPSSPWDAPPPLTATWLGSFSPAPVWGSAEAFEAAALLREAPADGRLQGQRARVMERAADAGLVGVHPRPSDIFRGQPSAFELRSLRELRAATSHVAHESVDPARLQSALAHWERWRAEAPSRVAFVPLHGEGSPGPAEAERYNAETFELFAASCLRGGSLRQGHIGQPLETDTVAGYVSALRAFLSRDGGIQMRSERHEVRSKALLRGVRRSRGPRATRRKRLGLRARHLQAAAANRRLDRKRSWAARRRWMAAVVCHSLVARGCELGRTDNKAFSPSRGLRWRNVEWHAIGSLNPTHAALTVHLCAAKDGEGTGPRFPMQIRRRAAGNAAANDALCAYDLLSAAWREDSSLLGEATALDAPVFRNLARGGAASAFETRDVRAIVREIASAAGEDPAAFGAHSLRIGGASDFRDLYDTSTAAGLEEAKRVLKRRGRWRSDIAFIYARTSLDSSLEASARLADVNGRDVESAFVGWAEPAL